MRLTRGVQRAAAAGEEEGRAGEQRAGPQAGLLHASWADRLLLRALGRRKRIGRPVELAGWLARTEQAEAVCEAYILSSFSVFFIISSLLFEFEFGSKI